MGTAAADTAHDLLSNFRTDMGLTANPPGLTVARIRGALTWDPTAAVTEQTGSLVGIIKEPSTLAQASVVRPSTNEHADWMMFQWVPGLYGITQGSSSDHYSYEFDVKSMRRLDEVQETIWLVWEQTNTADTAQVYGWMSVLLMLP